MGKDYDRRKCMVCDLPVQAYQVVTGIPIGQEKSGKVIQLYGHYHCIKGDIGDAKAMLALQLGLLPMLPDALFTDDKRLKKYVEASEEQRVRPLERVYEFINS